MPDPPEPSPAPGSVLAGPAAPEERIESLDVLRGVAILAILIINIRSFALPLAAFDNPTAYGDFTGASFWYYAVAHVLFEGKGIAIFSMLFGAGIVLMSERREARGRSPAASHYRRMLALLAIGLVHAYAVWYGDILVSYALLGMVVFLFRRAPNGLRMALGVAAYLVPFGMFALMGWWMQRAPDSPGVQAMIADWMPPASAVAEELEAYRGGYLDQLPYRAERALLSQTGAFLLFVAWRYGGLMLVGMAFFQWGILSNRRSRRFYAALTAGAYLIGLPVVVWGLYRNVQEGWAAEYSMFAGRSWNDFASGIVSLGHIGLVMLWCGRFPKLGITRALAATGRMALTNYLMQSIICTLIFYGHGFGLYGRVPRAWFPAVILGIWAVELIWSPLWLRHFRYGPFEWLWRCITYLRVVPIRKAEGV
jgi:uncharacterized protein